MSHGMLRAEYRLSARGPKSRSFSSWAGGRLSFACTDCYHVGMKQKARSVQYTLRGVPPEVDRVLRRKAAQRKQSLNQVVLDELIAAAVGVQRRADFSDLVGQWTPDPAFDEILAAQRRIHYEKWK